MVFQPTSGPESQKMSMQPGGISLKSIDDAYGSSADLYKDVLGVKSNATPEQIQRAYFARRNELIALMQNMKDEQDSSRGSQRFQVERNMNAVQTSMRILGDPVLRLQYDDIRQERLAGVAVSKLPNQPPQSLPKLLVRNRINEREGSPTEPVNKITALSKKPRQVTPDNKWSEMARSRNTYPSETEEDDDDTRQECPTIDQTYDEDQTVFSESTYRSEGTLTVHQNGAKTIIGRFKDEVFGAMEDTATSFAQVLNAFTLQEEDIRAVTKRIDKAARQMKTSL